MRRSPPSFIRAPKNKTVGAGWRIGFVAFAIFALYVSNAGAAQVLIVKTSDAEPYSQAEAALRAVLIESRHEVRTMLAKDVSEKGVVPSVANADAVVAVGSSAARWLHKQLPPTAKLVYCMVGNVDDAGLDTGTPSWGATTEVQPAEQIKVIAEALPSARSVGTLYRSDAPQSSRNVENFRKALPPGWRLESVAVNEFPSTAAAIDALRDRKVDVIWTSADAKIYDTATVRTLLLTALRSKIPVWGYSPAFVRAGALIGVGVEPKSQGKQAGEITLRVLAQKPAADDMGQPPRQFQTAVNLIVAQQLGIDIPPALTARAAFVFRPEN